MSRCRLVPGTNPLPVDGFVAHYVHNERSLNELPKADIVSCHVIIHDGRGYEYGSHRGDQIRCEEFVVAWLAGYLAHYDTRVESLRKKAAEARDDALRAQRNEFQKKWGCFLKCTACGDSCDLDPNSYGGVLKSGCCGAAAHQTGYAPPPNVGDR